MASRKPQGIIYCTVFAQYLVIFHCCYCQEIGPHCDPLPSKFDILFLVDSTGTEIEHKRILEFIMQSVLSLKFVEESGATDANLVAVAQLTPELRIAFDFNALPAELQKLKNIGRSEGRTEYISRRILGIPYLPCSRIQMPVQQPMTCLERAISLNSIVRQLFSGSENGNRPSIPDLTFLITTKQSQPDELSLGESLFAPRSPIYFYIVKVGSEYFTTSSGTNAFKPLEFSALTVHLGATTSNDLLDLVGPMCQSLHSFLAGDNQGSSSSTASLCFTCLALLAVVSASVISFLCYFAHKYRDEGSRCKKLLRIEQKKSDNLNQKLQEQQQEDVEMERTLSELPMDHPALKLPPVDVLFLVDASGSIGNTTFEQIKKFLRGFVSNIDVSLGRSRVANILFGAEPYIHFGFNRYHTISSVRAALGKMPYLGGGTRLAKALAFASGMLTREQLFVDQRSGIMDRKGFNLHSSMPAPRHDRLQVLILVSDGASDDNIDHQSMVLNERLHIKIAAVITKLFFKERMVSITRNEDAIFTLMHGQALNNWLLNQQKIWNERFGGFVQGKECLDIGGI